MSDTRVSVLTPSGTGAIATVAAIGQRAWELTRTLFRPGGKKPLPETPEARRFWFGSLGEGPGDQVVVAVKAINPEPWVEVHCHGGRRVVRWVVEQYTSRGCVAVSWRELPPTGPAGTDPRALEPLTHATTVRTASILLDQYHGAFVRALRDTLGHLDASRTEDASRALAALVAVAPVGRHLVEPWKVVIAGPPNVGKSSLVNALAGYQRSVVSEVAGTTRDVVTVPVAFDGWPVELADTAGLRDATELEAEGVARAKRFLAEADLIVWVLDGADSNPVWPTEDDAPRHKLLIVINKSDLIVDGSEGRGLSRVSAKTGSGVPGLAAEIAHRLVPTLPVPGVPVPFIPPLADLIEAAYTGLIDGRTADAVALLRAALPGG